MSEYGKVGCKDAVWSKAQVIKGLNPNVYRIDPYGNILYYHSYGKYSNMGWHIDHIHPQSKGGSHSLRNLQALSSKLNVSLQDSTKKLSRHKKRRITRRKK